MKRCALSMRSRVGSPAAVSGCSDIGNYRFVPDSRLLDVGIHPCASSLGRPCLLIGEEPRERLAVAIVNFNRAHRLIDRGRAFLR